ncbi:MAG TPA: response regulator [Sandaracinaceae bacterium LLY-WYZ-13_1]|nr:response regulator [Sandaracinaceae bacterium LLY-WYZ-13_1]
MGEARSIFVVDDDPEVVRLVTRVLEHDGFLVVGHTDSREALEAANEHPPALVFADLMMPHLDGEAFCLALRGRLGERMPPVVLLTASWARREVAERLAAVATLEKPFETQDVRDLAARFVKRRPSEQPRP